MRYGYFHVDSIYGRYLAEVSCYTDMVYHEGGPFGYYSNITFLWPFQLRRAIKRTARTGLQTMLNLQDPEHYRRGIQRAKPFWESVESVLLKDEPTWSAKTMTDMAAKARNIMDDFGLPRKPVGAILRHRQIVNGNGHEGDIERVGVEAYVPSRYQDDPLPELERIMDKQFSIVGKRKEIVVVGQAYDRNTNWLNLRTLERLQTWTHEIAQSDSRVVSLMWFSYGRGGGVKRYPFLGRVHKQLAGRAA